MKVNNNYKRTILFLTRGALICAIYTVCSLLSAYLTVGPFQFRLSEALCILPVFLPEAIPGLFLGCILANHLTGCIFMDTLLGSVATLIGAILARVIGRKIKTVFLWVATIPNILANSIIVPFVIIFFYGSEGTYPFYFFAVLIGEVVMSGILGTLLGIRLKQTKTFGMTAVKRQ